MEAINKPKGKSGHPRTFKTAKDLEDKIEQYFSSLEGSKEVYYNSKTGIPTVIQTPAYYGRLILYIGSSYGSIEPYEDGEYDDEDNKYSEVLTRARQRCEADLFEGAAKSQYNDRIVNAALMRHHGFSDKQTIEHTGTVLHQLVPASLEQCKAALLLTDGFEQAKLMEPAIDAEWAEK